MIAPSADNQHPLCFLHVPKSGGASIRQALEAALPEGSRAPYGGDIGGARIFSNRDDLVEMKGWVRSRLALDDHEIEALHDYDVVSGHFMLSTLLRIAPAANVATVLREPRARLLSLYLFCRTPRVMEIWGDYFSDLLGAASGPLAEFVVQPSIARATDNQVCRMLLDEDPRIPDDGFIETADVKALTTAALKRLDQLGYVGILESGDAVRQGLGEMFGVRMEAVRANESAGPQASAGDEPLQPHQASAALAGLEDRSAVDRVLYKTVATRLLGSSEEAHRLADEAFRERFRGFASQLAEVTP